MGSGYDVSLTGRGPVDGEGIASAARTRPRSSGQRSSWGPTPRCSASRAPDHCGCSAFLRIDTTAGQLPAAVSCCQHRLLRQETGGGVRAAAHVSPPQVQNSSCSPEPDLEWLSQRSGRLRNLRAQRSPDLGWPHLSQTGTRWARPGFLSRSGRAGGPVCRWSGWAPMCRRVQATRPVLSHNRPAQGQRPGMGGSR